MRHEEPGPPVKSPCHVWSRTNGSVFPLSLAFLALRGEKVIECRIVTLTRVSLGTFCVPITAKCFFIFPVKRAHKRRVRLVFSPKIKISRDGNPPPRPHRTTLLSRLRQAPGEFIADIPHFKHPPYVHRTDSHVTYRFLCFFHWFMFCLE